MQPYEAMLNESAVYSVEGGSGTTIANTVQILKNIQRATKIFARLDIQNVQIFLLRELQRLFIKKGMFRNVYKVRWDRENTGKLRYIHTMLII